jgi:uncharacterized protein YciI
MLFVITCLDKPESLALRQATRPTHLDYLATQPVMYGGPLLDDAGQPCGSMLVVDVADHAAAAVFAANDPYAEAGLFASTTIRGFRAVFKDGAAV